jgi:hypothetical protein
VLGAIGCRDERGRLVKVVLLCLTLGRGSPDGSLPTPRSAEEKLGYHTYEVASGRVWGVLRAFQGNGHMARLDARKPQQPHASFSQEL